MHQRIMRVLLLGFLCLSAGFMGVLWARSYEPPGPRYIEGPVVKKYTILPRQLAIYHPNDRSCIYASVVNGWVRIGRIDIQSPYGPAPKRDDENEEAWAWLGGARFPGPEMVFPGTSLITQWLGGLCLTGSIPFASGKVQGMALPCWLLLGILLAPVLTSAFRSWRRRLRPGQCPKCGYNLTGLPERRCPECGTEF